MANIKSGPRRWALAGLAMIAAALLLVAGLWYGVEEQVWDPVQQSYAYQQRPLATVAAWLGAVLAIITAAWGLRVAALGHDPSCKGSPHHGQR